MIEVMLSIAVVLLLTVISICFSDCTALLLMAGGGLMILITAGFMKDGGGKLMKILQLSLAVLFA